MSPFHYWMAIQLLRLLGFGSLLKVSPCRLSHLAHLTPLHPNTKFNSWRADRTVTGSLCFWNTLIKTSDHKLCPAKKGNWLQIYVHIIVVSAVHFWQIGSFFIFFLIVFWLASWLLCCVSLPPNLERTPIFLVWSLKLKDLLTHILLWPSINLSFFFTSSLFIPLSLYPYPLLTPFLFPSFLIPSCLIKVHLLFYCSIPSAGYTGNRSLQGKTSLMIVNLLYFNIGIIQVFQWTFFIRFFGLLINWLNKPSLSVWGLASYIDSDVVFCLIYNYQQDFHTWKELSYMGVWAKGIFVQCLEGTIVLLYHFAKHL